MNLKKSSTQPDDTAGRFVTTITFLQCICRTRSYAANVFPKRGFAFHRKASPPSAKYFRASNTASACSLRRK